MGKKECLAFLFGMILCYSLFQHNVRAQSSLNFSISSQGSINYTPSNVNLAIIPDDWGDYAGNIVFDGGTQICFLDNTVERTLGKPSIRLDPQVSGSGNPLERLMANGTILSLAITSFLTVGYEP